MILHLSTGILFVTVINHSSYFETKLEQGTWGTVYIIHGKWT